VEGGGVKETFSFTVLVDVEAPTAAGRRRALASLGRGSGLVLSVRDIDGAYRLDNFRPLRDSLGPVIDVVPNAPKRKRKPRAAKAKAKVAT
jgi:hypothetical protein